MEAIQLREELFREMNPMLDSEDMLRKMLDFVRSLFIEQQNAEKKAGTLQDRSCLQPTTSNARRRIGRYSCEGFTQ